LDIACLRTLTVDEVFAEVLALQPWVPKLLRGVEHTPLERE
jgi:hypothetical protein